MNNRNEIVLLVSSPFNQRDRERFGVELLQANGYAVKVWDFTPFLNPVRWKQYAFLGASDFKECRVFNSKKDAITAISRLSKNSILVAMFEYSYASVSIFRVISRTHLPYCLAPYNCLYADYYSQTHLMERLNHFLKKSLRYVFFKIPYRLLGVSAAQTVLMLGGRVNVSRYPVDATTDLVMANHFDYDLYMNQMQSPVETDGHLGVFLDSYAPFHPDWESPSGIDPEAYYSLLCNFFGLLEKKHGMHIVIAAHPRSQYERLKDYFGGRPVVRGKTAELVKRSRFVIVHASISINFAVLFKKPIIFVTTDNLRKNEIGKLTDYAAAWFNKTAINLNGGYDLDLDKEFVVSQERYQEYKNRYIKREDGKELSIWQTFADYLRDKVN